MEMTEELPTDIQKLCRTCMNLLQEELTAQNCLFVEDTATDLAMQFTDITSLEISPDDGLPNIVCGQCKEHLSYVTEFKKRCLKVNDDLLELIHGQQVSDVKIKEDPLQIFFSCNEPNCDYITMVYNDYHNHCLMHKPNNSLTELYCDAPPESSPLTNNDINFSEVKELVNELPNCNFAVAETNFFSENLSSHVLQTPIKCSYINEETECSICTRQYINKFELSLHFLKHAALEESLNQNCEHYFFCEFCGEVYQEQNELKEHYLLLHVTQEKLDWKCGSCGDTFEDDLSVLLHERMENHFDSTTAKNDTFKCLLCDEQFINVSNLLIHSVCHLINKYECNECQRHFISEDSLQNHIESQHIFTKYGTQIENKYVLDNSNDLSDHAITDCTESFENSTDNHTNLLIATYKCGTCRANFSSSTGLKRHMVLHTRQKFSCTLCNESFIWKYYLDRHMISKHKQVRKSDELDRTHTIKETYKCMYRNCNVSFRDSINLTDHIRVHDRPKACICEICGWKFKYSGNLKKHMLLHTGEKPFPCSACDRKFRSKYYLNIHMTYKHKSLADKLNLQIKKQMCEICNKDFVESSNLKRHMRVHTGESCFPCSVCGQKYKKKYYLRIHMTLKHKSKADEMNLHRKSVKCEFCDKVFLQSSNFTRHVRMHTRQKLFSCVVCDQKFGTESCLDQHLISKHKVMSELEELDETRTDENHFSCDVCDQTFTQQHHLEQQVISKHGSVAKSTEQDKAELTEKRYKCTYENCKKTFNISGNLKNHLRIHMNIKPYECESCKRRFSDPTNLKRHLLIHTGEKPFSCDKCDQRFRRRQLLENHMIFKHMLEGKSDTLDQTETTSKLYECTYANCRKSFNTSSNLSHHLRQHLNVKCHECKTCGRKFSDPTNLKRHVRIHTGEKPFSCNECNVKFGRKFQLQRHLISKHMSIAQSEELNTKVQNTAKLYECTQCNKTFNSSSDLTSHLRVHLNIKIYECETCKRKFVDPSNFKRHLVTHTRETLFPCKECNAKFRRRNYLEHHLILKHSSAANSEEVDKTQSATKPYECLHCEKTFNNPSNLTTHMRLHLNIKPYECETCKRKFSDPTNLKRHLVVHTGEKPFACNECDQRFTRKHSLENHMISKHTRLSEKHFGKPDETQITAKPYKCTHCKKRFKNSGKLTNHQCLLLKIKCYECEICEKKFADPSNLKRHMILHTGEMPFSCDKCDQKFRRKEYLKHHVKSKHTEVSESDKADGS